MASINRPDSPAAEPATSAPAAEAADHDRMIRIAVQAALDHKAEELLVLDLAAISDFTERFLICSGTNERQVQAIADAILKRLRDARMRPLHVEGLRHGHWVLLDYGGNMVVHVFLSETRAFYALERLWSDAPVITSQFVQ